MIWGPLSESYGRKWVMIGSFAFFTVFAIASAVAPNFAALVVFRMMVGIGGSCAISVVGGVCADVYHDPVARGRSMAIFMVSTSHADSIIFNNAYASDRQLPRLDRYWAHLSAATSL